MDLSTYVESGLKSKYLLELNQMAVSPVGDTATTATSCFTSDAIVATDQGAVPIRKVTTKNTIGHKEIKGISKTIYTQDQIVVVEKHAFGKNKPSQKTTVAPYHRFMINGKLQSINKFVNGETVYYII